MKVLHVHAGEGDERPDEFEIPGGGAKPTLIPADDFRKQIRANALFERLRQLPMAGVSGGGARWTISRFQAIKRRIIEAKPLSYWSNC